MRGRLGLAAFVLLAGCATNRPPQPLPVAAANWRTTATEADRLRLRNWRAALVEGLADARARGAGPALQREGALLMPDAALLNPSLPPGNYRCRVTKLGAKSPGLLSYIAYPGFSCRVAQEGDVRSFKKVSGSQRPVGLIFKGDETHDVFLGTLVLGDEREAQQYGVDPQRDMAGLVQRIGVNRWRLLLPYPAFESLNDVIELVPAPPLSDADSASRSASSE